MKNRSEITILRVKSHQKANELHDRIKAFIADINQSNLPLEQKNACLKDLPAIQSILNGIFEKITQSEQTYSEVQKGATLLTAIDEDITTRINDFTVLELASTLPEVPSVPVLPEGPNMPIFPKVPTGSIKSPLTPTSPIEKFNEIKNQFKLAQEPLSIIRTMSSQSTDAEERFKLNFEKNSELLNLMDEKNGIQRDIDKLEKSLNTAAPMSSTQFDHQLKTLEEKLRVYEVHIRHAIIRLRAEGPTTESSNTNRPR